MSFFKRGTKSAVSPKKVGKRSKPTTKSHSRSSDNTVKPSPFSVTGGGVKQSDVDKMANPLDWNNTPTFIKKHFPHWKDTAAITTASTTNATNTTTASEPIETAVDAKKSSFRPRQYSFSKQPANTAMYSVLPSDTLPSIALKFSTTPSELCRLNKMATRTVIPGQILYVPELDPLVMDQESPSDQPANGSLPSSFVEEVASTHIKIRAKYITTDQGCCKGSLLLTTASIMFKPSESDPLVLEHGHSPFGVILEMKNITYASIVSDFAKLMESLPKLQHSTTSQENKLTDTTETLTSDNQTEEAPVNLLPSDADSGGVEQATHEKHIDSNTKPCEGDVFKQKPPLLRIFTPSTEDPNSSPLPPTPGRIVRVFTHPQLETHDEMLAIMGAVYGGNDQENVEANPSLQRLMMNPDEMSFKMRSADVDGAQKDIDAPQFLKIRVASHAYHTFVPTVGMGTNALNKKKGAKVMVHTKTEFWFAFPSERTDELITFFMTSYSRPVYEGGVLHKWNEGVFVLIDELSSCSSSSMNLHENHYSNTSSSWEVYSLTDIPREKILKMEVEDNLPMPVLTEQSDLMEPYHVQQVQDYHYQELIRLPMLSKNLISTAVGHDWILLYSTFKHGMSLKTLYRNMAEYGDSPILLFVKDNASQTFGAVLSCQLKISKHYYGTGESFLFKFKPNTEEGVLELKVYRWSGDNDFIAKGNSDSLVLGGGEDGQFGLWIDDQFYHGASYVCKTFNNECLSSKADFICYGVEAWGFV